MLENQGCNWVEKILGYGPIQNATLSLVEEWVSLKGKIEVYG
jgi:hypothetical protein